MPLSKMIVGGLLGGWLGLEVAKSRLGIESKTGDLFVWPLALGLSLGRLGCFLTGLADHTYGLPTTLPWGVDFGDHVLRHPTQMYEMIFVLLMTLVVQRRQDLPPGGRFRLWMAAYLGFRFLSDWLKPVLHLYAGLSAIQWASLLGLIYSLYSLRHLSRLEVAHG